MEAVNNMSKLIWIKCKQVCEYNQQHVVTDEEYKILMDEADGGDVEETHGRKSPYGIIDGYLDSTDIFDTEREFTDVSIELDKLKKSKKK